MKVIKRDSSLEDFNIDKIKNVLLIAFEKCNIKEFDIDNIISYINTELMLINNDNINIELIQDIVEKSLMNFHHYEVAKHYINYRTGRNNTRESWSYIDKIPDNIETKWGQLGYITYKRTYARRINEDNEDDDRTEEFHDSILRVLKGCQRQLNTNFTNKELKKAYYYLKSLKGSVAGRFLWQLNTKTVDKLGLMSLQNCAFTKIDNPIRPFLWIFSSLMVGSGIGFNIQKENIDKLPNILDKEINITRLDTNDADFIIPDSREGWVSLLEKVLEAFFYKGKSFTYSTILIRSKGRKIKGFGGLASGPEELVIGIKNIQNILNNKRGKKLSSVDCLDIINIIASIVVSGNVRRCLPKGSLVHTNNGLCKIENMNIGDKVLTYDGTYEDVNMVFIQGKQKLITIKTNDGFFKCTPNHKMAVLTKINEYKWKTAETLNKDDILISSRIPVIGTNTKLNLKCNDILPELNTEIAWLFGLYQTYIIKNNYNNINSVSDHIIHLHDYYIASKIKNTLDLFNNHNKLYFDSTEFNDYVVFCNYQNLINFIKSLDTNIPDFILNSTLDIRLSYIAGIIDINNNIHNYNLISSVNEEFVLNIQKLCYSCGFETRFYKFKNIYNLDIITIYSQNIINTIPELVNKYTIIKEDVNCNYFTEDIYRTFINKNLYSENKKNKLNNYNCNINYFDKHFYHLNYCPINIIDIEYNNEVIDTYDIEVNNKHEFFCNGYLTHNSALVALGDYDDIEYLRAKRWDLGNIPNWRALSNNSVICDDISKLPDEFWNGYNGNGEPYGLINLDLSRKIGRIKDKDKYKDPTVEGYNPCLTYDTYITTTHGLKQIKELINIKFDIIIDNKKYSSTDKGFWCSKKDEEVYKIELENGLYIKATKEHQFKTLEGWKMVKDLIIGTDKIFTNLSDEICYRFKIKPSNVNIYTIKNIVLENIKYDVYDCTIPTINSFVANGMISHNCCEISLSNYETCCLSEIYLCNIENYEELKELAIILYRICKHSLIIKCHEPETEEIVHKNTRMGIGITGYMQSSEEQKSWLDPLYEYLREYDIEYSKKINVKPSIKLTTVKPSGTLSLLAGVTSGAHPAIYQYFIRRIRIASNNHNLINLCKSHGYFIEYQKNFDGTDDFNTNVVEFPCKYPEGCILAENMNAIDQLNTIKDLQYNWSDNAVSVTIYYKLEELNDIKKWLLENYTYNIKTCSFLLHNEHGFNQAPFEKISKEKYDLLISKTKPITSGKIDLLKDNELISECVGGVCPIR